MSSDERNENDNMVSIEYAPESNSGLAGSNDIFFKSSFASKNYEGNLNFLDF